LICNLIPTVGVYLSMEVSFIVLPIILVLYHLFIQKRYVWYIIIKAATLIIYLHNRYLSLVRIASLERGMINSRTKAGIEKAKIDGVKFGRTLGSKNKKNSW
jgi:hypothetical protein